MFSLLLFFFFFLHSTNNITKHIHVKQILIIPITAALNVLDSKPGLKLITYKQFGNNY